MLKTCPLTVVTGEINFFISFYQQSKTTEVNSGGVILGQIMETVPGHS